MIAVAVSAYAGTRSQLRGQVDRRCARSRRRRSPEPQRPAWPDGDPADRSPAAARRTPAAPRGPCQGDDGLGLDRLSGPAFGGAPGIYTLFNRCGGTFVPTGQGYSIPSNSRIEALARSGTGQYITDMTVSGHADPRAGHRDRKRRRARGRAAAEGRQPHVVEPADVARCDRGRRDRAGRAARLPGRAHSARADRAVHAADRVDRRSSGADRPSASRSRAPTSSRGWRGRSTARSTRWRRRSPPSASSWPTRRTSCARRSRRSAPTSS